MAILESLSPTREAVADFIQAPVATVRQMCVADWRLQWVRQTPIDVAAVVWWNWKAVQVAVAGEKSGEQSGVLGDRRNTWHVDSPDSVWLGRWERGVGVTRAWAASFRFGQSGLLFFMLKGDACDPHPSFFLAAETWNKNHDYNLEKKTNAQATAVGQIAVNRFCCCWTIWVILVIVCRLVRLCL